MPRKRTEAITELIASAVALAVLPAFTYYRKRWWLGIVGPWFGQSPVDVEHYARFMAIVWGVVCAVWFVVSLVKLDACWNAPGSEEKTGGKDDGAPSP